MTEERIILVDEEDREIGAGEKLAVHRDGRLHRAFSIFVGNGEGQLLLQKRAAAKYHSGGLWSNTCCGHPRAGEALEDAVHRRLREEFGFDCGLRECFAFTYRAEFGNGLIEHEVDHVYLGEYHGIPAPNPEEIEDWQWIEPQALLADIRLRPERYSYWLRSVADRIVQLCR